MSLLLNNHAPHCGCHVEAIQKHVRPEQIDAAARVFLVVWGMGCPNCALRVRNSLLQLDGVLDVQINLERGLAQVFFDPVALQAEQLPDAVAAAGNDGHHRYLAQVLVTSGAISILSPPISSWPRR